MRKLYIKKLKCFVKEIYKFFHGLSPPRINDVFQIRGNIYHLRNFQALYSSNKKTVKFGAEAVNKRPLI